MEQDQSLNENNEFVDPEWEVIKPPHTETKMYSFWDSTISLFPPYASMKRTSEGILAGSVTAFILSWIPTFSEFYLAPVSMALAFPALIIGIMSRILSTSKTDAQNLNAWLWQEHGLKYKITKRSLTQAFKQNYKDNKKFDRKFRTNQLELKNASGDVVLLTLNIDNKVEKVTIQRVTPLPQTFTPTPITEPASSTLTKPVKGLPQKIQNAIINLNDIKNQVAEIPLRAEEQHIYDRVDNDLKDVVFLYKSAPKTTETHDLLLNTINGLTHELEKLHLMKKEESVKNLKIFDMYVRERQTPDVLS